jgi:hypothetical protein
LAFHSYPQLIQAVFNQHWFGPPVGVTRLSPWPWVDHLASRLFPATDSPCSDSLSLRLAQRFASPLRKTSRLIMQKARGQAAPGYPGQRPPTACRHTVSGTISLPSQGCFSPFPHGTGSLSVAGTYLALEDGPSGFPQGSTCPAVLRNRTREPLSCRLRGCHPVSPIVPDRSAKRSVSHSPAPLQWRQARPCNTAATTSADLA